MKNVYEGCSEVIDDESTWIDLCGQAWDEKRPGQIPGSNDANNELPRAQTATARHGIRGRAA
jgi:hypothetical protein